MASPSPLFTVRQLVEAWGDGRAMTTFLSADVVVEGAPPFARLTETTSEAGDREGSLAEGGWAIRSQALTEGSGGRVLGSGVWTHDGPDDWQGSAGAFQVVFTVTEGLVTEIRFFEDHAAASEYAGVPPA